MAAAGIEPAKAPEQGAGATEPGQEYVIAWCLVWLIAPELEIAPFLVSASDRLASITGVSGR